MRMESAGLGTRNAFQLTATQTQVGDALGLTSSHVNRTFKALRTLGLISIAGKAIRVPDWHALARAGDFDSSYLSVGCAVS